MVVKGPSLPRGVSARFSPDEEAGAKEGKDLRSAADEAHDSLDSDAAYSSAPSAVDTGISASGRSLDVDGRDLGFTLSRGGADKSTSLSAGLSLGSGYASLTTAGPDKTTTLGASLSKGWLGGSGEIAWASLDGGQQSLSAGFGLYPGGVAVDAGIAHTTSAGKTLSLGGFVALDADRDVCDLGPALEGPGLRRIEVRRSTGTSGTISPGAASALIGVGGRLSAGKERAVVYRTTVSDDEARELAFEKKGVVGWLRDKARALGGLEDPVVIPDLRRPESLRPGDELVTTASGSISGGLFIGGLPLRLGAQGVLLGELTLGVRKLDEDHVELVVTPTDVRAIQGRIGAPWLLEGDLGRSASRALAQGFVFDLRDPAARAAYDRALDGELPGGLPNKVKGRRREAQELIKALEEEALPSGTQRTFLDQVELKRSSRGVSTTFALWFKGGDLPGLGIADVKLNEARTHLSREGAFVTDTRGVERRRQVLLSGNEERGIFASLRRATTFTPDGAPAHRFEHLKLTLKLSDSKVWGKELDEEVIALLNEHFGLELSPMERDGRKKSRELTVTRTLAEGDLERLAALAPTHEGLSALRAHLADGQSALERATAVQRFVAEGGLSAMAAIVKALGEARASLVIETAAEAYDGPIEKARQLALKYPRPLSLDEDNAALSARVKAARRALKEAELGLLDLKKDPLLDEEARAHLAAELGAAAQRLSDVIAVKHLDGAARAALIERLERGWTSGAEREVIELLAA